MTPAGKNAALLFLSLGGAYGAYRYLYLPWKVRQALLQQSALLAQQRGISQSSALQLIGSIGCQALAASYGLPPAGSSGLCSQVGAMAAQLLAQAPAALTSLGTGIANAGSGIGSATNSILTGAAGGWTSVAKAPINVLSYGVGTAYSGVKTVASDAEKAAKTVAHDLNPLNWF